MVKSSEKASGRMKSPYSHIVYTALICIIGALPICACSRSLESSLRPPETPILTGGLGWALVKESYVRLKEKPLSSASDLDHLRKGSVLRIEARAIGDAAKPEDKGIWYRLQASGISGWVRDDDLDVFRSEEQAERAGVLLK
jgi:hypothetical protein